MKHLSTQQKAEIFDKLVEIFDRDNGKTYLSFNSSLKLAKDNHPKYQASYRVIVSMNNMQELTQNLYKTLIQKPS